MKYLVNVHTEQPGLYRLTYGRCSKQVIAMLEEQADGWHLMGHYTGGPYKTKRQAKQVFGAFAPACYDAGGPAVATARRAGQLAARRHDPQGPPTEPISPDPMINMAPTFDEPMSAEEIRRESVLTESMAWRLIRLHRQRLDACGYDPFWAADRKRIIEADMGGLVGQTQFEKDEYAPHIRA